VNIWANVFDFGFPQGLEEMRQPQQLGYRNDDGPDRFPSGSLGFYELRDDKRYTVASEAA
jgi:hypothetical protein